MPDAIKILMGLKPYFEEHHDLRYTNDAIKSAVELAARYIHDRKLPDSAIDVIDEAGAAQHLLSECKRRKTLGTKEIEAVVAKIARIPPKTVSKDDAETLRDLEKTLKRVVFGQDKAVEALCSRHQAGPRRPARAGKAHRQLPVRRARPASARPKWPSSLPRRWAWNCCASTCRNTWRSTRFPA